MTEPVNFQAEQLLKLLSVKMPFGKYAGRAIADLPGNYLNWFAREGFPQGELGRLLALMQTIDHNGLKHLLSPLKVDTHQPQATPTHRHPTSFPRQNITAR